MIAKKGIPFLQVLLLCLLQAVALLRAGRATSHWSLRAVAMVR
nr:hypothetical protein [Tepidimonas ignava]